MNNLDEQYENLYDFVKNLEILIQKNVFDNQRIEEISFLGSPLNNMRDKLMPNKGSIKYDR